MAKKETTKKETKAKKTIKTKDTATTKPKVHSVMEGKSIEPVTMEDLTKPFEGQVAQIDDIIEPAVVETVADNSVAEETNTVIEETTVEPVDVPSVEEKTDEIAVDVVEEQRKEEKTIPNKNRLYGYNWNGQIYDY